MSDRAILIVERNTLAAIALKELALAINPEFDVQILSQEPLPEKCQVDLLIYGFQQTGQLLFEEMGRVAQKYRFVPRLFVVDEVSIGAMRLASQSNFQLLARTSSCFHILDAIQAILRLKVDFLDALVPEGGSGQSPIKFPAASKPLTVRHVEVLEMMSKGLSNKQIAMNLGLSQDTIAAHLREAFHRLKAKGKSEALTNYMSAKRLAEKLFPSAIEQLISKLNERVRVGVHQDV